MLIVLSPSKTLDYDSPSGLEKFTQPALIKDAEALIKALRGYNEKELSALMDISPKLAALNAQRYRDFSTPFTPKNARQALLAFKGDVYEGIEVEEYKAADFAFAQQHLRILSGLYGVLRPLDLMQPYRLEMGTKLPVGKARDLYAFWGERITHELNAALRESGSNVLLNLASEEYFSAVVPEALKGKIVTISFKEKRGNKLQTIGLLAKKARGRMANAIVRGRINETNQLKKYAEDGYRYEPELSGNSIFTFIR